MLGETPELSLVNDHPSLKHRCEDPTKALIILFDLLRANPEMPNLERIVDRILLEAIARQINNDFKIT